MEVDALQLPTKGKVTVLRVSNKEWTRRGRIDRVLYSTLRRLVCLVRKEGTICKEQQTEESTEGIHLPVSFEDAPGSCGDGLLATLRH